MTVAELMKDRTINQAAEGEVTADDYVFAIDISDDKKAEVDNYVVVQEHTVSVNASFSPDTTESQYIRSGKSTTKTGTQETYSISGDRYVGDPAQDFLLSYKMIYARGEDARIPYVRFNILNGKGVKGIGTVIVNSDSSGDAGSNSTFDVEIRKSGANPQEFQYVPKTTGGSTEGEGSTETPGGTEETQSRTTTMKKAVKEQI